MLHYTYNVLRKSQILHCVSIIRSSSLPSSWSIPKRWPSSWAATVPRTAWDNPLLCATLAENRVHKAPSRATPSAPPDKLIPLHIRWWHYIWLHNKLTLAKWQCHGDIEMTVIVDIFQTYPTRFLQMMILRLHFHHPRFPSQQALHEYWSWKKATYVKSE